MMPAVGRGSRIPCRAAAAPILEAAKAAKSDEEHLVLLVRQLARLRDGHAAVKPLEGAKNVRWPTDPKGEKTGLGFFLCRIGKSIYVKNAFSGAKAAGLAPGDEVKRIGGKGIEGIGIRPHLTVEYDPKDLAAEKDTQIERAEQVLLKFPQKDVPYDPKKF